MTATSLSKDDVETVRAEIDRALRGMNVMSDDKGFIASVVNYILQGKYAKKQYIDECREGHLYWHWRALLDAILRVVDAYGELLPEVMRRRADELRQKPLAKAS